MQKGVFWIPWKLVSSLFQDKTYIYAAECLQIHIHGKDDVVHCSCLYYRITKVKEVDIACALIYAKELAHKEIELNKNKYKIEDTAAKVQADNTTKEISVLSLQSSLQNICSTI